MNSINTGYVIQNHAQEQTSNTSLPLENTGIDAIEKNLLDRGNCLSSKSELEKYNQFIRAQVGHIRSVISDLQKKGLSGESLSKEIKLAETSLGTAAEGFLSKCETYQKMKAEADANLQNMSGKIQNTSLNFNAFQIPVVTMQPGLMRKMSEKLEANMDKKMSSAVIEEGMDFVNAVAVIPRAIDKGVGLLIEKSCNSTNIAQKVCKAGQKGIETAIQTIPESWRVNTKELMDSTHNNIVSYFEETHGIAREKTSQFLGGAAAIGSYVAPAAALKVVSKVPIKKPIKISHTNPNKSIDPFKSYKESVKDFASAPKEFNGALKKDLYVVQYHNNKIHLDRNGVPNTTRSLKWFMPVMEANKLPTMEQVLDRFAILGKFGERTHATVAKVPAGEQVRFLYGKAGVQVDPISLESRLGGGIQYRFADFKPDWILATRELPKAVKP